MGGAPPRLVSGMMADLTARPGQLHGSGHFIVMNVGEKTLLTSGANGSDVF